MTLGCFEISTDPLTGYRSWTATRDIGTGELICTESPEFWAYKPCGGDSAANGHCYSCGSSSIGGGGIKCDTCAITYCSQLCKESSAPSHRYICSDIESNVDVHSMLLNDDRGYKLLLLKIYATILEKMMILMLEGTYSGESVNSIANDFLSRYHHDDYCATQHCVRTGLNNFTDDIFLKMIAPAYYKSFLSDDVETIKKCFSSHEFFVNSIAFTELYVRKAVSTFVMNALAISMSSEQSGIPCVFAGLGLYPLQSKMNHSCENNSETCGDQQSCEIKIFAVRAISKGDEITTSYIDKGRYLQPRDMSVKKRRFKLRQFLFDCKCHLCAEEREGLLLDTSSSDDDSQGN